MEYPPVYIARMIEDGRKLFTKPFPTVEQARLAGRRTWQTNNFAILELNPDWIEDGLYEVVNHVAH